MNSRKCEAKRRKRDSFRLHTCYFNYRAYARVLTFGCKRERELVYYLSLPDT